MRHTGNGPQSIDFLWRSGIGLKGANELLLSMGGLPKQPLHQVDHPTGPFTLFLCRDVFNQLER